MGLNPFTNSSRDDKKWSIEKLDLTPIDPYIERNVTALKKMGVKFNKKEVAALEAASRGMKKVDLSASQQRDLIRKAKAAEKKFKKDKK